MISRRAMIASGVAALAGSAPLSRSVRTAEKPFLPPGLPEGVYDTATHEALPGKKPLIKLSYRPPNYETPLSYFTSEFTANESFFVRYHLANIPGEFDTTQWNLKLCGDGAGKHLELSLAELRSNFDAVEIAAVCQCSGSRVQRIESSMACYRRRYLAIQQSALPPAHRQKVATQLEER
jgi:hypothetical protein